MTADVLGKNRAQIAFILERIELAAPDLHDGELARHEKGIEQDQPQNDRQFAQDDERRIPVVDDGIRQGGEREKWK